MNISELRSIDLETFTESLRKDVVFGNEVNQFKVSGLLIDDVLYRAPDFVLQQVGELAATGCKVRVTRTGEGRETRYIVSKVLE